MKPYTNQEHGSYHDHDHYDTVWKMAIEENYGNLNHDYDRAREAAKHAVEPVLDVGCGVYLLCNLVVGRYVGLDFSTYAVKYSRDNCTNPKAGWIIDDVTKPNINTFKLDGFSRFNSVIMCDILEHLVDYQAVFDRYAALSDDLVIVTVPVSCQSEPSHVHPEWSEDDCKELFKNYDIIKMYQFGFMHNWRCIVGRRKNKDQQK